MTYFNHYTITPGLGLREEINLILATDCVTGDGIEKLSNYLELEAWALKSLVPAQTTWYMASYATAGNTFKLAPRVTGADMKELVEALEWLIESPILSDTRYNDMVWEETQKQLKDIAEEWHVDPEVFVDVANDHEVYGQTENGEVYVPIHDEKLEAILTETKRTSQTEHAHYYGGQWHSPEHCARCQEFPQLIGARA